MIQLLGMLFLNFYWQGQCLLSQAEMRLKLIPSKLEVALNANGAKDAFKVMFEEVVVYVPRLTLNNSVINEYAAAMKRQNAFQRAK